MNPFQVHDKFDLMHETLFLTVNLIDRFLEKQSVVRKKLQLVGLVAMLLACKYEEVSVPVVGDLILISDRAYTRKEVLEMVTFLCLLIVRTFTFITFVEPLNIITKLWSSYGFCGDIENLCRATAET